MLEILNFLDTYENISFDLWLAFETLLLNSIFKKDLLPLLVQFNLINIFICLW